MRAGLSAWPVRRRFSLTERLPSKTICGSARVNQHSREGYSSGQRGQTVNLLANAYVGSNPTPSTKVVCVAKVKRAGIQVFKDVRGEGVVEAGGCSSMVELQPSKLIAWVRFPSPAPKLFRIGGGWSAFHEIYAQAAVFSGFCAHLAQSVEHTLGKGEVAGSIPVVGTRFLPGAAACSSADFIFVCCISPKIVFG